MDPLWKFSVRMPNLKRMNISQVKSKPPNMGEGDLWQSCDFNESLQISTDVISTIICIFDVMTHHRKCPLALFGRKRNSVLSVHRTSSTATNSARSFSDSSTSLVLKGQNHGRQMVETAGCWNKQTSTNDHMKYQQIPSPEPGSSLKLSNISWHFGKNSTKLLIAIHPKVLGHLPFVEAWQQCYNVNYPSSGEKLFCTMPNRKGSIVQRLIVRQWKYIPAETAV